MSLLITNIALVTHESVLENHWLLIEGGIISSAGPMPETPSAARTIDGRGRHLMPGAVEIHIHGAAGVDAMDADENYITAISRHLPRTGTTAFLATTMTTALSDIQAALENLSAHRYAGGAEMLGIHLEGPFISGKHPGAQDPGCILPPDADTLRKLQAWSGNRIRIMTYAPEEDAGYEMPSVMKALGILPSAGHTDAAYRQLEDARRHGLQHITHLYNGMRGLHHREPGVVGYSFLGDAYVELIADGIHSAPEMVKLAYDNITSGRMIMITDAMRAQGLGDGVYDLGGQEVFVEGGAARLADGTLAGSVLTMKQAVKNMFEFTGCGWTDIVRMTSYNALQSLGLTGERGLIRAGHPADLVMYDEDKELVMTIVRGEVYYGNHPDS
ncbi:N-acetylglucosamine-6-phosphate deacetylase [Lacicoccus alkaliphilus]|uniref:N-acetylglucosamine-6-phosphate deacetylase n=1 Tax=Lacicoccus alkaliphilus DSM 16010 TaxID=1123231 RepID=A0A1M7J6N3_9BACL|nr:N-acetylglucosamine-6-phosphate deacetylase [Salinicoccus alkaliphilus]SHM48644.1 N-acetylglucosamine-6-phosphate deacetylase [Salinicoccus alkaliphilus DSM 16010]